MEIYILYICLYAIYIYLCSMHKQNSIFLSAKNDSLPSWGQYCPLLPRMHAIKVYREDDGSTEKGVTHCLGQSGRAEEEMTSEPGFVA